MNRSLLLFCLLLTARTLLPAQVSLTATVDTADILIGDQFRLNLLLRYPPGTQTGPIELQALDQNTSLELVRIQAADTIARSPEVLIQQQLIMTSFDSGYHYLPEIPVAYRNGSTYDTVRTNPIPVMVRTIPLASDTTQLQPIKEIIKEPVNIQDLLPWILGILGLAALLLGISWWWKRKKGKEEITEEPEIIRPAHEIALEKLTQLRNSDLLTQKDYKNFQSELTYIFREYLENRYHINALESTSDEVVRDMRGKELPEKWTSQLRQMLQTADLVKFAKAAPPHSFHESALATVEAFVQDTRKEETETDSTEPTEKQA